MIITLRFSGAIASAVAGEITRLEQHPDFYRSEGVAYKAAFDRLGSFAEKHTEACRRDCLIASLIGAWPRGAALNMARLHAGELKP